MIIGIAGKTASGKTTVAKHLGNTPDAFRIKASDILLDIAHERGITTDKQSLQHLSTELRREHGEDFLAREVTRRASAHDASRIVIEGNRRLVDLDALKKIARTRNEPLALFYIDASLDARYARYNSRESSDVSREVFAELETDECEDELAQLREYIKTHGTIIDTTDLSIEETLAAVNAELQKQTAWHKPE